MGNPSSSFGKRMQSGAYAESRASLEADLASADLYGYLPFGDYLRQSNANVSRAELEADLNAPGSLWHIF